MVQEDEKLIVILLTTQTINGRGKYESLLLQKDEPKEWSLVEKKKKESTTKNRPSPSHGRFTTTTEDQRRQFSLVRDRQDSEPNELKN